MTALHTARMLVHSIESENCETITVEEACRDSIALDDVQIVEICEAAE